MNAAIVLAIVAALSLVMVLPQTAAWMLGLSSLLLPLAIVRRAVCGVHIALFACITIATVVLAPLSGPLNNVVALSFYATVVAVSPPLRRSVGWLRLGQLTPVVWILMTVTVGASAVALQGWVTLTAPDLTHQLASIPALPIWAYPLVAVAFALLNAAMEEGVFRGVMMEALDRSLGAGYWSIGIQALSFGALHYVAGFPNGALGFCMAFVYGVMLGVLRRRSGGLLAPWLAHVMTDIVIFAILLSAARGVPAA